MRYRITYRNLKTGCRENYLNIGFDLESAAQKELILIKKEEKYRMQRGFEKTRTYFKVKPIKMKHK